MQTGQYEEEASPCKSLSTGSDTERGENYLEILIVKKQRLPHATTSVFPNHKDAHRIKSEPRWSSFSLSTGCIFFNKREIWTCDVSFHFHLFFPTAHPSICPRAFSHPPSSDVREVSLTHLFTPAVICVMSPGEMWSRLVSLCAPPTDISVCSSLKVSQLFSSLLECLFLWA